VRYSSPPPLLSLFPPPPPLLKLYSDYLQRAHEADLSDIAAMNIVYSPGEGETQITRENLRDRGRANELN
jgi:hypothetical protein